MSGAQDDLSVVVCTHNPRQDYLHSALEALRAQTLSAEQWELVVVDNASDPPLQGTVPLAWHPRARVVREERVGLTAARLRGFAETSGALCVLVDDDNDLAPDYLAQAAAIAAEWTILGAWGGQTLPGWEREPEPWTRPFWPMLGVREFAEDRWSNVLGGKQPVPIGAGMCVRRSVVDRYREYLAHDERRAALDRTGTQLLSGGDIDLALTSLDLGLGTGLFARLKLVHRMPPRRTEEVYLRELVDGLEYSAVILNSFRGRHPVMPSRSQRFARWLEAWTLDRRARAFAQTAQAARARAARAAKHP